MSAAQRGHDGPPEAPRATASYPDTWTPRWPPAALARPTEPTPRTRVPSDVARADGAVERRTETPDPAPDRTTALVLGAVVLLVLLALLVVVLVDAATA